MSKVKCKGCGNDVKIKIIRWGNQVQCENCACVVDFGRGIMGIFSSILIFLSSTIGAFWSMVRFYFDLPRWIFTLVLIAIVVILMLAHHYLFCFIYDRVKAKTVYAYDTDEDPNGWTPPKLDLLPRRKEISDD